MAGTTEGLATLLRLLNVTGGAAPADGQGELFEAEDAPIEQVEPAKGVSGPQGGRPLNARNRSTDAWVALFLSQNKSPLMVLGEIYSRSTEDLTAHLQGIADKSSRMRTLAGGGSIEEKVLISPLDVMKLRVACANALMPYVHKAQPKAIEIERRERGVMILGDIADAAEAGDDLALPLPPEPVKDQ